MRLAAPGADGRHASRLRARIGDSPHGLVAQANYFLATRIPARALRIVVASAAVPLLVAVALRSRSLLPELGGLRRSDPGWLLVGDLKARIAPLLRATLGGIAMTASLPGGAVASAGYWYKQLRREGAGRSLSAVAMVGSMLAGALSLACLFVAGVAAAGSQGPLAPLRLPILAGAAGGSSSPNQKSWSRRPS